MTYMPQDFRGTLIRQQRERSERNKQAEIDTLVKAGGSIHDRYALLWKQQMERWIVLDFVTQFYHFQHNRIMIYVFKQRVALLGGDNWLNLDRLQVSLKRL